MASKSPGDNDDNNGFDGRRSLSKAASKFGSLFSSGGRRKKSKERKVAASEAVVEASRIEVAYYGKRTDARDRSSEDPRRHTIPRAALTPSPPPIPPPRGDRESSDDEDTKRRSKRSSKKSLERELGRRVSRERELERKAIERSFEVKRETRCRSSGLDDLVGAIKLLGRSHDNDLGFDVVSQETSFIQGRAQFPVNSFLK